MSEPPTVPYGGPPNPDQPGYPPASPPGYPPTGPAGYPPAGPSYPPSGPSYSPSGPSTYPPAGPPAGPPGYPPPNAPGYPPGSSYTPTYQAPAAPSYPAPPPYYTGPPAPGSAPVEPPKKASVGKIIGIVAGLLIGLCVTGGAIFFFAARNGVDKVAQTRVSAPASVAGRAKSTDPQVVSGMAQILNSVQAEVTNTTSSVAAGYGEPNGGNFVVVVAVSGLIPKPEAKVDEELAGVKSSDPDLTMATPIKVDAGPLGGVAKCAQLTAPDNAEHAVCVWADNGSVGVVIFYEKAVPDVRSDFLTIRGQVEQQG